MDFEVTLGEKLYNFICPCLLPTRIKDESKIFIDNVELKLNHITNKHCLSVALGDLHPSLRFDSRMMLHSPWFLRLIL